MFFTFWGSTRFIKGASSSASDWLPDVPAFPQQGRNRYLASVPFSAGAGHKMIQVVMKQNRMPGVPELMQMALDLDVRFSADHHNGLDEELPKTR